MKKLAFFVATCSLLAFAGENLLKNGNGNAGLENWSEKEMSICSDNAHSGDACFQTISKLPVVNTQIIPVNPAKKYVYRLWLRTIDDKPVDVYILMRALDKDKKPIPAQNITVVKGTDTVLVAPCKATDTVLYVKNAEKFRFNDQFNLVAFQTKPDLSDLPNSKLSKGVVKKIEKKGNQWVITLSAPCGIDMPSGTAVREHRYSAAFMYPVYKKAFKSTEWQKVETIIYPESSCGATGNNFWKGTKYVQLGINPRNGAMLYVDDIEFQMLDK